MQQYRSWNIENITHTHAKRIYQLKLGGMRCEDVRRRLKCVTINKKSEKKIGVTFKRECNICRLRHVVSGLLHRFFSSRIIHQRV